MIDYVHPKFDIRSSPISWTRQYNIAPEN